MEQQFRLHLGDCLEVMKIFPDNEFSTVLTDPPYGLGKQPDMIKLLQHWMNDQEYKNSNGFMGKDWDVVPGPAIWKEVYRVLKPGGYALVFAGTRTYDLMTLALRLAGFRIVDCCMWLYGSGFPKSHNISKAIDATAGIEREVIGNGKSGASAGMQHLGPSGIKGGDYAITAPATNAAKEWDGWGTALKPAWEPIIMAMKPLDGTYAQNALEHGVAGLRIDGCRIEANADDSNNRGDRGLGRSKGGYQNGYVGGKLDKPIEKYHQHNGRWPANLILDEAAAALLDEQSGERPSGGSKSNRSAAFANGGFKAQGGTGEILREPDTGSPSRYFTVLPDESRICYTAKASTSERNEGLDGIDAHQRDASRNADQPSMNGGTGNPYNRGAVPVRNSHPTVKPLSLMRWLVRLTRTPKGGVVLDPFAGSGSTGVACLLEGRQAVLIEKEPEYCEIARYRLEHWQDEADVKPKKITGTPSDLAGLPLLEGLGQETV